MIADIKMEAGYTIYGIGCYVHNLEVFNQILFDESNDEKYNSCIGVWKIKQLKTE